MAVACTDSEASRAVIMTPDGVLAFFENEPLREDEIAYLRFHRARYAYLLRFVEDVTKARTPAVPRQLMRILDIGPAFQTPLMRAHLPDTVVNTLGLQRADQEHGFMARLLAGGRHWSFDLNESRNVEGWPQVPEHDVVAMAEVIEHLHTAPRLVLRAVSSFLRESGLLILQTPNACALHKRLKMLAGRNPSGPIEEWCSGTHFREYTARELAHIGLQVGLTPVRVEAANYFRRDDFLSNAYNAVARVLPRSLRAGLTVALCKTAGDAPH